MSWKPCPEQLIFRDDIEADPVILVTLTCDRPLGEGHEGAHHDPVYKFRWKADGDDRGE